MIHFGLHLIVSFNDTPRITLQGLSIDIRIFTSSKERFIIESSISTDLELYNTGQVFAALHSVLRIG